MAHPLHLRWRGSREAAAFAGRLRELRLRRGWSQSQLAFVVGISRQTVFLLESKRVPPSWPTVLALCEVFGVTPQAFMEKPTPQSP